MKNREKFLIKIFVLILFSFFYAKNIYASGGSGWFYWVGNPSNEKGPFNTIGVDEDDKKSCLSNFEKVTVKKSSSCYWGEKISVDTVSPTSGNIGDIVTINGLGFLDGNTNSVSFNGIEAKSFTVNSSKKITAIVPENATSGYIKIISPTRGEGEGAFFRVEKSVEVSKTETKTEYDPTYQLLAPIGDFKEFETNDIGKYLNILVKLAIGICGALAVIMIIINGVMYMGEGSIFKKAQAKDGIMDAIIGLLIALGSWAILNTINPDLLGGRGLSIRVAKLDIDMDVHGDEPQAKSINCNGRIDANSETTPTGRKWSDDSKERSELQNVNINIRRSGSCIKSGETSCTSLTGLNTSSVINFKKNKCPTCELIITGGTECWLHSPSTTHFPGKSTVDFAKTSSLTKYIEGGKLLGKTEKGNFSMYEKDGTQFLDEGNHYHIIKW